MKAVAGWSAWVQQHLRGLGAGLVQVTGALATYKDKEKGGGAECRLKGWGKGM